MSHEIDETNGKAAMAYVGGRPWHGLGQQLTEDADIATWKKEAGLNWKLKASPVIYQTAGAHAIDETVGPQFLDSTKQLVMPDRQLLFRSDTKAALSVVSDKYKIVQPGEVLDFYKELVESAGFKLETAGALFGGRKFWALARCGDSAKIMGQDEIKPYLLLASSCDGSMATVAHFTSVRVVCNNTLRMSIGPNGRNAKIRVPHNADFDHDAVQADLGIATKAWDQFLASVRILAKEKINRDDAIDVIAGQMKKSWLDEEEIEMPREKKMESSRALRRIITLFDGEALGADFKGCKGTSWGLLNAVTQYVDHESGSSNDKSRAFERAHLTDRANFKVAVADELLKIAG